MFDTNSYSLASQLQLNLHTPNHTYIVNNAYSIEINKIAIFLIILTNSTKQPKIN